MSKVLMNVDFDSEVLLRRQPITVADIRSLLCRCRDMGVDTVVWRCTCLGRADYRSRILDRSDMPLDVTDVERAFAGGRWFRNDPERKDEHLAYREGHSEKCREILASYDPPQVVRDLTAELGMELYLWLDIFDEYYPGFGCRFLREHPDMQWVSRNGGDYFEGLRSYAWPQACANQLDAIRELVAYEPDGVYLCSSCHANGKDRRGLCDAYGYGFEEPVVQRYRERRSVDIRSEEFDRRQWDRVKGEFVTDFFRQVKNVLRPHGIKLMLFAPIGDHKAWGYWPWNDFQAIAEFHVDWRRWVDEQIADSLVLGEYQFMWRQRRTGHWQILAKRTGFDPDEIETQAGEILWDEVHDRCDLFYWSGWVGEFSGEDDIGTRLNRIGTGVARRSLHGVVYHEMMAFEREGLFPRLNSGLPQLRS